MKKKAFTLQELLITLGIVGVIAAISIPAVLSNKPDETKMKYMKAYNALATLAPEIANDEGLFRTSYDANGDISGDGLLDTLSPINADPMYYKPGVFTSSGCVSGQPCTGTYKFAYFLSRRMNLQEEYKAVANVNNTTSFTTSDGVVWTISWKDFNDSGNGTYAASPNYKQVITIDVNGTKAPNSVFSANCQKPDQFTFDVGIHGDVEATDALGKAFLLNSSKMNEMKEDRAKAKEFLKTN